MQYGYCYDLQNSADRPIARQFKRNFNNFYEFEFDALYKDFKLETDSLNLCDYNKVTLYEAFFARGRRYISGEALVINGCFKEVVPVFMSPDLQSVFA